MFKIPRVMKKIFNTLSIVGCILSLTLNAQTSKTSSPSTPDQATLPVDGSKSQYISSGNYLSPSSLQDYKNYFGDSLKGFNESAVKADLLERHFNGVEYINVMNYTKRKYINNKYKIGPDYAFKPSVQPSYGANSKPIGGGNSVNVAPCVNEDFETTSPGVYTSSNAVTGWTVENATSLGNQLACHIPANPTYSPGSPEFSIVTTPILGHPFIGNIPNSPLGGNNVAVLNNTVPGFTVTRISTSFPVTQANTLFQFAYAGAWDGSGHLCCDQPFFEITMFDCSGNPLSCSSISLTPPGNFCANGAAGYSVTNGVSWCNWQVKYIDLTPYIGTCVTLRVTNGDCDGGAHFGSLYFDAKCGGQLICSGCNPPVSTSTVPISIIPVSFCAGSGQAQICAPAGYATYSWVAPPTAPILSLPQSTQSCITILNPSPGWVYTLYLTSPSGCQFVTTDTLKFTQVNISGIGSSPSCAGGASGQATVSGIGSGTGYNYTWLNSSNVVVGTTAVVTGLAPGVYSVILTGLGAAGCGSAVATTTVGISAPGVTNVFKPFCGTVAYLNTNGGSNFQWYNGTTPLSSGQGGNSSSLTITNPPSGSVVTLGYNYQGCRDSIRFTLASTNPGFISPTNVSWICPGGTNGTALINLIPAIGAPGGFNTISVSSSGTTAPYAVTTAPSSATTLALTGLSAGVYTVNAFDGSCYYNSSFTVNPFVFNFTLSPVSPTLCPGNCISAGVTFTSPPSLSQYSYSWSPTIFLPGGNGWSQSTIICPTVSIGSQTTIVYTVVVTPSTVNCPVAKTLTITAINPPTPTISAIPNLCNNSTSYQILTTPSGGSFSTSFTGSNSPIGQLSGIISPSHTNIAIGTNSFVYSIAVNTCIASTSGSFEVSRFWTSALTSSVPPLCVTSNPFNLMTIVQSTVNGSWSGSQGVSANMFNPAGLSTNNYVISYNTFSSPNPTACPAVTALTVAVTNTITPFITPVAEFCNNSAAFTMTVNPPGGNWTTNSAINTNGLVTPSTITTPSVAVNYSVTVGPCINTNTTTLQISQFIPSTLSGTVPHLCYNSSPVNLMSIVQNTSGVWSILNSNTGIQSNSFVPSGLATNIYTLKYTTLSSPNPLLCPDNSTIAVSLLNPPTPTITQVGPFCNNANSLVLNVSPNTGHWIGTTYLNTNGVFSPSLCSVGNNIVQYVIGTNTCNTVESKLINVEAFVPSSIIGQLPDLCNTNAPTNLMQLTLNNLGSWSGPGISGNTFNPSVTGAGNFTLSYHTNSSPNGLCPDESVTSVHVYSLAAPVVTKAGPFCTNSLPVQLQVSPVGGMFGGQNTGVVNATGKFNPSSALIGNNVITYSISSGPCIAYAQTTVQVEKFISAAFEKEPGPFCKTSEAVNLNSYVQNPVGTWSQSQGLIGSLFYPSGAHTDQPNIITHFTHSAPTASLCPDQATISVEVRNIPVITASGNTKGGCVPLEVQFSSPNTNSGYGVWTIGDGSEPINALNINHVFTHAGTYTVQFNYTDDIGCKANPVLLNPVTVHENPKVNFSLPEEILISDPKIQLTNLSTILNDNTYEWSFTNMPTSKEVNPVLLFKTPGKYTVTLKAKSIEGCEDELTKTIEVKNNFSVFIPNSFSPNFDGLNDVFIPVFSSYGLDIKSYEMEIFDRWGHSLFHSKDFSKGWDGASQNKGEISKEDVYIYHIKYKDLDGNTYDKTGHTSLVK